MATVKLFGNLRRYSDGSQLYISGASVSAIMEKLCDGNPTLCESLFENGALRPHFKITLNGHDIFLADGLETSVGDDDQIAIFSPIAGG